MYPLVAPPISDTGAWTWPRTLQRWLDVNPVTKLTRTSTFITLPSFNVVSSWNGYSDIVASFNCEAPNNFSLSGTLSSVPLSVNYTLCISYRVGTKVTRYVLWIAQGAVMNQAIPLYVGQPILKNFRFEIWNTSAGATSQATSINFYTSVLGKQDYRYAVDGSLVNVDGKNTAFSVGFSTPPLYPATTTLTPLAVFDYQGLSYLNSPNWTHSFAYAGVPSIVGSGSYVVFPDGGLRNNKTVFSSVDNTFTPTDTFDYTFGGLNNAGVVATVVFNAADVPFGPATFISLGNLTSVYTGASGPTLPTLQVNGTTNGVVNSLANGQWYVLIAYQKNHGSSNSGIHGYYLYTIGASGSTLVIHEEFGAVLTTIDTYSVESHNISLQEIMIGIFQYENDITSVVNNITSYLLFKYANTFALPLVLPPTSVSTTN